MPFTTARRSKKSRHAAYGTPAGAGPTASPPASPAAEAEAGEACAAAAMALPEAAAGPRVVLDRETGGQFVLGQNHPNPCADATTVPFTLSNGSEVRLDLFDAVGRKVIGIHRREMSAGAHTIQLNLSGLGLRAGTYHYQLQVTNSRGVYRQSKPMTTT